MVFNKSGLLGAMRLKTETVEVGDGSVIISEISAVSYSKLWASCSVETGVKDANGNPEVSVDMAKFTPALLAYAIVDENGLRIFSDEEIPMLEQTAAAPFLKLAAVAKRLNGFSGDEGNSSEPTTDGSTTGE